jgi:hypothetical protein
VARFQSVDYSHAEAQSQVGIDESTTASAIRLGCDGSFFLPRLAVWWVAVNTALTLVIVCIWVVANLRCYLPGFGEVPYLSDQDNVRAFLIFFGPRLLFIPSMWWAISPRNVAAP